MITNNQFYFNNGKGAAVEPSALILNWYNSLAVKPSNALLTSLNTLVDGLDADGNWSKLDLFGLLGGMETEEQQLRPLITTSGDDFVINGTPILDANGVNGNGGSGYLDLKWNPTDDGAQFTLNSAFISSYVYNNNQGTVPILLGSSNTSTFGDSYIIDNAGELSCFINYDGNVATFPLITNGTITYYSAAVYSGGEVTLYKNATTNVDASAIVPVLIAIDFFGTDLNVDGLPGGFSGTQYCRHFMAGAGTANQTTIQSRLNTFYTSRGL